MKKQKQHRSLKRANYQLGGIFQAGSGIVDTIDQPGQFGERTNGGAAVSGALKGAGMGMALGPVGAIGGAIIGGVAGLIGNKKKKEAAEKAEAQALEQEAAAARQRSASIMANYNAQGTGIKEFQSGGKLSPVSVDAVEVQGNDPAMTDDVQLGDAFVDHGEIISPDPAGDGLRIFSDTLKVPGTKKTFSKAAKKLEKEKTAQESRFPEQNNLVERKLSKLFSLQQMLNGNNTGETLAEAKIPAGESPGSGFSEAGNGAMFQVGGQLTAGLGSTPDLTLNPTPEFKTKAEFDQYHINRAKLKLQQTEPELYKKFEGNEADIQALIALRGGIPTNFTPPASKPGKVTTSLANIDFKVSKVGGYRYKQDKPAKGSITRPQKSSFQEGGKLRDYAKQPLTLEEWKFGKGEGRDWNKYPLTPTEIKGWTGEVQARHKRNMDKLYGIKPDPKPIPYALESENPMATLKKKPFPGMQDFKSRLSSKFRGGGFLSGLGDSLKNINLEDLEDVGKTASAVVPGLINMGIANKLPKPGRPRMDVPIQLKKVDFGDVQNQHNRNMALELKMADQASSNPNMAPALRALAFGRRGENLNRMFGESSRINAGIDNQQAMINQQVQGQNNLKLQGFDDAMAARRANQLGLRSQATNSIFSNLNTQSRERNQMQLDNRNADIYESYLETVAPGMLERHKQLAINKQFEQPKAEPEWGRGSSLYNHNKKGGKLLLKSYRLGGSLKKLRS